MNLKNIFPVPFRFCNRVFYIADYLEKNSLNLFNQIHQLNTEGEKVPNSEKYLSTLQTIFESCAKIKEDINYSVLHQNETAGLDLILKCQINFLNKQFECIKSICRDILEPAELELV